jgi:hypothetical protein
MMVATVYVSDCEKCVHGARCKILNRYRCGNSYLPEINTNFNLEKKFLNETDARNSHKNWEPSMLIIS